MLFLNQQSLESTTKHLMNETRLCHKAAHNLVRIGQIYKSRNIPNGKNYPESNER